MKLKILIVIVVLVVAGGIGFNYKNEKSAWEATYAWSGISKLPSWAENQKIETSGNMFTRTFIVTFSGSKDQIESWMKNEPALQKSKIEKIDDFKYKYILEPQGGSSYDEVTIDLYKNEVTIRASWS